MTLVIDASVVVKWFVEEDLADEAANLLRGSTPLYAPDLIVSEITNTLWKKFIRGHIASEQAKGIADAFSRSPLQLVSSISLYQRALGIAIEIRHPVYDCLYLACAETVEGTLITADQRLRDAVRGTGLQALVGYLGDPAFTSGLIEPSLQISLTKIEEVARLAGLLKDVSENVRRAFASGNRFEFISSDDLALIKGSPNYRRLHVYLENLSRDELVDLLALGWLGQGYSGTDWPAIRSRAEQSLQKNNPTYLTYVASLLIYLEKGLAQLQAPP